LIPHTLQRVSPLGIEVSCERLHPFGCAEVLRASSPDELVAIAMEHGAYAHGFTPAWYTAKQQEAMAATVARSL